MEMTQKTAKTIRIATIPPFMAAALLLILHRAGQIASTDTLIWMLFFLSVMPVLAYPVCYMVPYLRVRGRKMQRSTAVVFSIVGYIGSIAYCVFHHLYGSEFALSVIYSLSGIGIKLFSVLWGINPSGHASGFAGPVTMLSTLVSPVYFAGLLLFPLIVNASLKCKRHTKKELLVGAAIPMFLILVLMKCIVIPV